MPAFCLESKPAPNSVADTIEKVGTDGEPAPKPEASRWQKIWGNKAKDALLLGMWSIHLSGSGEYLGDGGTNEQNKLLGIQYNGFAAGTFINSHDDRAWFVGIAREVYTRKLSDNTRLDIGYTLGPLYGYEEHLPNIGGISIFGAGTVGLSWHRVGVDFIIIPVGVIAGGFRFNFN